VTPIPSRVAKYHQELLKPDPPSHWLRIDEKTVGGCRGLSGQSGNSGTTRLEAGDSMLGSLGRGLPLLTCVERPAHHLGIEEVDRVPTWC
jgi:hypothetical protein